MNIDKKAGHIDPKVALSQAEHLAVKIAFDELGMTAVNADAIMKNTRSQHVLEKVGFHLVGEDGAFKYYRIER